MITSATFSHLWYVRDRLGSVRSVVDATGTILQNTAYYASGVPVQCFGTHRVTDRGHIGNRYLDFAAIDRYDNTARMHDALLCRFTTRDPLAADYPSLSPYAHCAANPLRYIDPSGQELKLTGDSIAIAQTINLYNDMVGKGANVTINRDGIVEISRTGEQSTMDEAIVINLIEQIVTDKNSTKINVVNNSHDILIGDASNSTIDIGDIMSLGNCNPTSSNAVLLHETNEQFLTQSKNINLYDAHNKSIGVEAKYTGYTPLIIDDKDYSAEFSGNSFQTPGNPRVLTQRHVKVGGSFGTVGHANVTIVLFMNGNVKTKMFFPWKR